MIIILLFRNENTLQYNNTSLPLSSHLTITYLSKIEGKCIIFILTSSTISALLYQRYIKADSSLWEFLLRLKFLRGGSLNNLGATRASTSLSSHEHQHLFQVMSFQSKIRWGIGYKKGQASFIPPTLAGSGQFHTAHPHHPERLEELNKNP